MSMFNIPGTHLALANLQLAFLLVFLICLDHSASNNTFPFDGIAQHSNHLNEVSQNLKNQSILSYLDTDPTGQLLKTKKGFSSTLAIPSIVSKNPNKNSSDATDDGSSPSSSITPMPTLSTDKTPATTQAIKGNGTKVSFICSNVTLKIAEYHVPSNDIHIKHLKLKLSNITRSGEIITLCKPVVEDKIVVRYPSTLGIVMSVFLYTCCSLPCAWLFIISMPKFFVFFIFTNVFSYFLICVLLTGSLTEVLVYFIPFHLNFMFFLVSGWITLLSCKVVLRQLKAHKVFRIVNGKIVLDAFHMSQLITTFSLFMPLITLLGVKPYMMSNTDHVVENVYFKLMAHFTPAIIFLLLTVMCIDVVFTSQRKQIKDLGVRHTDNYLMFFCYHMFAIVAWVFGFLVVGLSSVFPQFWQLYMIVAILLPISFLKDTFVTNRVRFLLHAAIQEAKPEDIFRVNVQHV